MALKNTDSIIFEFAFVDRAAYRIADAVRDMEYLYNIGAAAEASSVGFPVNWSQFRTVLVERKQYGLETTNLRLREMLPEESDFLHIKNITSKSPVKIQFSGALQAVRALLQLFDPVSWADRLEELRHKRSMHRIKEEKERLKIITEKIKQVQSLALMEGALQQSVARGEIPDDFAEDIEHLIRDEVAGLISKYQSFDVHVKPLRRFDEGDRNS